MAGFEVALSGRFWVAPDIQTKAVFQFEIEEQRRTVERLKETTWGVVLHEGEEGRKFVVLPAH